jgi:ATP phosphoribosyltransferase regulatory subunit
MVNEERWLLPEGIEEALPNQAERLEYMRRALLDLYHNWGYELVITPLIEYLESLLIGTGHDLDIQTFKLMDQLTGRLMGLRADMTPQVARIDAHMLNRDVPTRLCYIGTVLRTQLNGVGGSRSPLQVGAELYGHSGVDSDVEIIRLMLQTLKVLEVPAIHMDLGHVVIYKTLSREARLSLRQEFALFDMLQRKAIPEIETFLDGLQISGDLYPKLLGLADLNGGSEVLSEARSLFGSAYPEVSTALDYIERVASAIQQSDPDVELYFDLAELRGYNYKTGIVFAAFVQGYGQEVARGGRYNDIGQVFGRARPATGFSADLKILSSLMGKRFESRPGIFVPETGHPDLQNKIDELRSGGERVICALTGQQGAAADMSCDRELVMKNKQWVLRKVN